MLMEQNCSVKHCDREIFVKSKKLCGMHYRRLCRNGKVGEAEPRKKPNGTYSKLVKGKQVWIEKGGLAKYVRKFKKEKRKTNPNYAKSIGAMHKKRFGGLREQVLERDSYTCQMCGMTDKEHKEIWNRQITIDHYDKNGRYADKKNHNIDNMWVLCLSCHGKKDRLITLGKWGENI